MHICDPNVNYYVETPEKFDSALPVLCHMQQQNGRGAMAFPHIHSWVEILFCESGEQEITLNNERLTLSAGELLVVSPGVIHAAQALAPGENRYIVISFRPEQLYSAELSAAEFRYLLPITLENHRAQKHFSRQTLQHGQAAWLARRIYAEFTQQSFGYDMAVRLYVGELFLWLLRYWYRQGISVPYEARDFARQLLPALDYIHDHYADEVSVRTLAQLCGMSYSYFSRLFCRFAGSSAVQYLRHVRLAHARTLLAESSLPVTEIAQRTGFSTSSYFIEQFRHAEGISPHQYRLRLTENRRLP